MATCKPGDLVKLKSGGPTMTLQRRRQAEGMTTAADIAAWMVAELKRVKNLYQGEAVVYIRRSATSGRRLGVEDDHARAGVLGQWHHAGHRPHRELRADRQHEVAVAGGALCARDVVGDEALPERDRRRLQDAAAR